MIQSSLKNKLSELKSKCLILTEEDKDFGLCTHKDPDNGNEFSLVENADGTHTCSICEETFNISSYKQDTLIKMASDMIDIIQNIKLMYIDIPEDILREYSILIPLLKNIPQLYRQANSNFEIYDIQPRSLLTDPHLGIIMAAKDVLAPMFLDPRLNPSHPYPEKKF